MASLILHQVKEVGTVTHKESNTECKTLTYISLVLTILGLVMIVILHYRKSKLCSGCMFSNTVKIMIFISDVQYYVPIKLCKTAGSIHLLKIRGMLRPKNIKLNWNYILDTLEIDWKEVSVTLNDNKIYLPRVFTIKLKDKIKIRSLIKKEPLLFNMMFKKELHGSLWPEAHRRMKENNTKETVNGNIDNFADGLYSQTRMQLPAWVLQVPSTNRNCESGSKSQNDERHPHIQETLCHPGHILQSLEFKAPSLIRKMKN